MEQIFISHMARATLDVSVMNRNDCADYDYLDKLNTEELNWLKGFNREYVNADFRHNFTKVFKLKKHHKAIYAINNARNRDIYSMEKWAGGLFFGEPCSLRNKSEEQKELFLVTLIDYNNNKSLKPRLILDSKGNSFKSAKEATTFWKLGKNVVRQQLRTGKGKAKVNFYWDIFSYGDENGKD